MSMSPSFPIQERVLAFGEGAGLRGIATVADGARGDTAVILLNAGVIHRVGSCRLSVEMAREIAARAGLLCLRFDYSGLGDSVARRSQLTHEQRALVEIVAAMDCLERQFGCRRFVLFGLCSGARDAVAVAAKDERVSGLVLLDGYAYRTVRYYVEHYRKRVFSARKWREFIRESLPRRIRCFISSLSPAKAIDSPDMLLPDWDDHPARSQVAALYRRIAARKVQWFVRYTGSWGDFYNYPGQFFDIFSDVDFDEAVTESFAPALDHIHSDIPERARLSDLVVAWLQQRVLLSSTD